ncbi:MAG TPA: hypothetical protein PKK26_03900, partial [Candidatus Wallbacteria bacterium]|nr:hypothetical protein [Candidatus Wallbacteria bacterium]
MKIKTRGLFLLSVSITLLSVYILLFACMAFAGGSDNVCPLPKKYQVEGPGGKKENANPGVTPISKALNSINVPDGGNTGTQTANHVVFEDEEKQYSFKTDPGGLTPKALEDTSDSTTGQDFLKWMPKMATYHPLSKDKSLTGKIMVNFQTCYKFSGGSESSPSGGVRWSSQDGWKVNKVYHAFHMDSPNKYGATGKMGFNDGETTDEGKSNGRQQFPFTYSEPSVPAWFVITSALTISWDWKYKYEHEWIYSHIDVKRDAYPYVPGEGICDICRADVNTETNGSHWTTPADCDPIAENWLPKKIFTDIQDGSAAKDRMDTSGLYYDENGITGDFYDEKKDHLRDQTNGQLSEQCPIVVARATVRVKDRSNIAHAEIIVDGGDIDTPLKAECGKKISEYPVQGDKTMIIRIVDNAVHCTKDIISIEKSCPDGEWKDTNFKAIFWYELPIYQYASYQADKWKGSTGPESPIIEIAYSPMFMWKKKKIWNSYTEFFGNGDGSTETTSKLFAKGNGEGNK